MDRKTKNGLVMGLLALALAMTAGTLGHRATVDPNGVTNSCSGRATVDPNGLTQTGSHRMSVDPDGHV